MIKSWPISFIFIKSGSRGVQEISGAIRNSGRWSGKVAVKLPEIILGKPILEKFYLLSTVPICSMWRKSTEMKMIQGTH